jgi:flagellar biosynthesis/type III secretory pathway protein FliH
MSSGPTPRILRHGSPEAAAALGRADALLDEAQARAREVVAAAEEEAARLRAAAAGEAVTARRAAADAGHAEGMGRAAAALALAAEVREAKLAELDSAVVEVALEIARRLVGRELSTSPDAVVEVAGRALRAAAGCGDIVLRASPEDLETLRAAEGRLGTLIERGTLTTAPDPRLGRGEVVVEAPGGRVDARIEAQLEAFRRALQVEEGR